MGIHQAMTMVLKLSILRIFKLFPLLIDDHG